VHVRLNDDDTGFDAEQVSLTVDNLAPTAVTYSLPASVNEGSLATVSITGVTDVGTLDTFTYSYVVKKNAAIVATSGGFIAAPTFSFTPDDAEGGYRLDCRVQAQDDDTDLSPSTRRA